MGGKTPRTPPVVVRDPVEDERKALAEATQRSNADVATKRRRRHGSTLLTMGASGAPLPAGSSLLAQTYGAPPAATGT